MVLFAQRLRGRPVACRVSGEEGAGAGTVDVVGGVAKGADGGEVGAAAPADNGVVDVFPETGLVE